MKPIHHKILGALLLVFLIISAFCYYNYKQQKITPLSQQEMSEFFLEDKKYFLENLQAELKYTKDPTEKAQIQKNIDTLTNIKTQEKFYQHISMNFSGGEYEEVNEKDSIGTEDEKKYILTSLFLEKSMVKNTELKKKVEDIYDKLSATKDKKVFFDIVEKFYEDTEINKLYSQENLGFSSFDESVSYNFSDEKKQILSELQSVLGEESRKQLAEISDEDEFFSQLHAVIEKTALKQK